jgi:hypothetical protein
MKASASEQNSHRRAQERDLVTFSQRTLTIAEMQPRQNLDFFLKKLKNIEFRSKILHDRIDDVLNKFRELDAKKVLRIEESKIGNLGFKDIEVNHFIFDFYGNTFNFLHDCTESKEVINKMKKQDQIFVDIERIVS